MKFIITIILMSLIFIPGAYAENINSEKGRQIITPYGAVCKGSYGMQREHMAIPDAVQAIRDFGCHMEAYIKKGKTVVRRLSISGNNIFETG